MRKNCHNCKHMGYYHKDGPEDSSPEGFFCEGRAYGHRQENCEQKHLEQLQSDEYRSKSKRCCELKEMK